MSLVRNAFRGATLTATVPCEPFVVLHLLPDPDAATGQQTKVAKVPYDPVFDEKFSLYARQSPPGSYIARSFSTSAESRELHVGIWDHNRSAEDEFLGHAIVDLAGLRPHRKEDRWYTLLPRPGAAEDLQERKCIYAHFHELISGTVARHRKTTSMSGHTQAKLLVLKLQQDPPKGNDMKI